MNWDKLPAHRRIVLQLKWWREDTLWLDNSQWFRREMSLNPADRDVRLDDNNITYDTPQLQR
jgi:hypothetical protein